MGAWDAGSFDNDTACDWAGGLENTTDLSMVLEALAQVLDDAPDYVEADAGSNAIAACEVIARLKGNWGTKNAYTESVDKWVLTHPQKVPPDLAARAGQALDRILAPQSELEELWEQNPEWIAAVVDLRKRVSS